MQIQWWPATVINPHTAITFDCLCHFEKVNASGHITATDYYRALAMMSNPTGLSVTPVRTLCPFVYMAHTDILP
jgi:hypothetical protein